MKSKGGHPTESVKVRGRMHAAVGRGGNCGALGSYWNGNKADLVNISWRRNV